MHVPAKLGRELKGRRAGNSLTWKTTAQSTPDVDFNLARPARLSWPRKRERRPLPLQLIHQLSPILHLYATVDLRRCELNLMKIAPRPSIFALGLG